MVNRCFLVSLDAFLSFFCASPLRCGNFSVLVFAQRRLRISVWSRINPRDENRCKDASFRSIILQAQPGFLLPLQGGGSSCRSAPDQP